MIHSEPVPTPESDESAKAEATRVAIGESNLNRARSLTGRMAALAGLGMAVVVPLVTVGADGGFPTSITFVR